jgi:uncharacterized protein (DUF433 family)
MLDTITIDGLITRNPRLRGGRPIIAGTGIMVQTVVGLYKLGYNPEEIAGELPLSFAQVYAALTYYHLHTDEIEAGIREDSEAIIEEFGDELNA